MSVVATKWAKRQKVRTTCRVVLTALADYADKAGRCWPSQATLASDTGLAIRTVRLVLAELTAAGVISRTHRGNGSGGRASDVVVLNLGQEFDLLIVEAAPLDQPDFPADDAGKVEGGYRHIKVGLAAYEGRVSGTTCRGKNLSGTTKNLIPSRDRTFQDLAQGEKHPGLPDPYGDDAFGPDPGLGLVRNGYHHHDHDEEFAR
ncbi:helix-turn-helix domain-containing protein [Methylobacterium sp. W2]|uniref:helix-turn-helix domain-containing protein n=1 Tax=Methylobacterium sp. W2 TaxID=2598107 RepID=UPI001D0C71C4|nr:helix-turn-helix domain-containing protein [Methylobacterium sp. W2]MCC0809066.1 helix-turn-helix domain-containing protein [Methylobacterium sp. W2]